MRNVLFVLILLAVQASAQEDGSISSSPGIESDQGSETGESVSAVLGPEPPLHTPQGAERLLMGLLAAAAIGFQLRRKYKASQRVWQRIVDSSESKPPRPEPPQEQYQMSSAVRWQQTQ